MRHVLVAVLVVLVINAQLTWWIVFILRLNRENLDLERRRLTSAARFEATRIEAEIKTARTALEAALVMGDEPGRDSVPSPFVGWRASKDGEACPPARLNQSEVIELGVVVGERCVSGVLNAEWRQRVMDVGDELVVTTSQHDGPAGVKIPEPFDGISVRPRAEVWQEMLEEYRRRIIMMVSEGSFFALLLLVLIGLLWRSFRREVELERQHRNFLSAITHELKSPLAAIRLAIETVAAGRAAGDVAQRFLGNALEDADRLEDLVHKVLEATRYGDDWSEIDLQDENFSHLVEESVDVFSRRALATGVRVDARIAPDIHAELDREAMALAVSNLLENAVKYGGEPPVVEIDLVSGGSGVILEVSDNGSGILEGDEGMIFGRFYRSGDEMTRTTGGTGLGLYLVQQIVEAHHGKVAVAATGRDGTTFRVTLPGREEWRSTAGGGE
jgi:signal transduction histidine kinase